MQSGRESAEKVSDREGKMGHSNVDKGFIAKLLISTSWPSLFGCGRICVSQCVTCFSLPALCALSFTVKLTLGTGTDASGVTSCSVFLLPRH